MTFFKEPILILKPNKIKKKNYISVVFYFKY